MTTPSEFMLRFLATIEELRLSPYQDAAGLPTVGYGHKITPADKLGVLTKREAESLLSNDAAKAIVAVNRLLPDCKLLVHEIEALSSLVFNIGSGNFDKSTIRRKLMAGDIKSAAWEFRRWSSAKDPKNPGKFRALGGLRRRRIAEELWFLGGSPDSVLNIVTGVWE